MLVLETYHHVGSLVNPIMEDPYPLHVYVSYTAMTTRVKRVDWRLLEYRNVGFVFIHSKRVSITFFCQTQTKSRLPFGMYSLDFIQTSVISTVFSLRIERLPFKCGEKL